MPQVPDSQNVNGNAPEHDPAREFSQLLAAARAGDERAMENIVKDYGPEIRRFIRVRLTDLRIRRLMDSVDVCQSVLARFFEGLASGNLEVRQPAELVRLLTTMARNRVVDHVRQEKSRRRGGDMHLSTRPVESHPVVDSAPDPSEAAMRHDLFDTLKVGFDADDYRLVEQCLSGRSWEDLSNEYSVKPDALRKRFTRAVDRAAQRVGLLEKDNDDE